MAHSLPALRIPVLTTIHIGQDEASGCCCTWTRDPLTGAPYVCVGGVDAKVKIYDVSNGRLVEVSRALDLYSVVTS